jgi:hypothetical protein
LKKPLKKPLTKRKMMTMMRSTISSVEHANIICLGSLNIM